MNSVSKKISSLVLGAALLTSAATCNNVKAATTDSKNGVYYEVFVRSFADSNDDGIGDLKGLTQKLDYLNDGNDKTNTDLGVNGIWLMPINVSPSYHKYDVTDYYNIDPEYGTIQDFEELIKEAHKRGIKVIMDLVVNHTSAQNPWFQQSKDKNSPYRDYYTWVTKGQKGYDLNGTSSVAGNVWHKSGDSYYYGIFWDQMPDLKYDNTKVREEVKKIAKFWLEKGVDGFRLDAALHIYGAYEVPGNQYLITKDIKWWTEFRDACKKINPNVYLVGEVWDQPEVIAPFFKSLDSNFDFAVAKDGNSDILRLVKQGTDDYSFASTLEAMYNQYAKSDKNFIDAPFLSNHDQDRSMSVLNNDIKQAKLAANIYLTLPGNPFIYYGEELGMNGAKPDENIREPFKWFNVSKAPETSWEKITQSTSVASVEKQQQTPSSLLNYYKKLIKLRQSSNALTKGNFKALTSSNNTIVAYSRNIVENKAVKESVVVLHNLSDQKQTTTINVKNLGKAKILFDSSDKKLGKVSGSKVVVGPQSTLILKQ